ncbi:GIY-YIG nuclease family protein [Gluconacetobacter sacchari]|uniref:GIY-YIG nuclease family protein n=2 Tax=Gluconacetobacter sacchari TaxID=92759 RepID=A0A7W4ICD5_9PROT|nr:GIY-YIG nuclease family protein [Gluconacetobacter sacchari]
MQRDERKVAIVAYKERRIESGVYAVRCMASGETWVGGAPDLRTIQNRIWFTLRHRSHPTPSLQQAWHLHGADGLCFEVIERLKDDESPADRDRALKDLVVRWADRLRARRI